MDFASRERLLVCKSKEQNVKAQLRNQFEIRQLKDKLGSINTKGDQQQYILNRRIHQLREDMWRSEMIAQNNQDDLHEKESITELQSHCPQRVTSAVLLQDKKQRIKSAPNFYQDIHGKERTRIASGSIKWRKKSARKEYPTCQFGTSHQCTCFPCKLPLSYTNIGFDINHEETKPSKKFIVSTYTSKENRERLLLELEGSSVRRPLRTSLDQTVQKERSLKKIIADMKVKSEREQPKDWSINYGKPTPKRKIYRAARPSSSITILGT